MLPRHPEGADLRENRWTFRLKAVCERLCEPLLKGDAWGNGVQMVIACATLCRSAGESEGLAPTSTTAQSCSGRNTVCSRSPRVAFSKWRLARESARCIRSKQEIYVFVMPHPPDGGAAFWNKMREPMPKG